MVITRNRNFQADTQKVTMDKMSMNRVLEKTVSEENDKNLEVKTHDQGRFKNLPVSLQDAGTMMSPENNTEKQLGNTMGSWLEEENMLKDIMHNLVDK